MGHLNSFSARGGEDLNKNFPKIQMPGGLSGGGMSKLRFDWYITILGSVNLRKTFRGISDVWENAETLNLEKWRLYLCPITLQSYFLNSFRFIFSLRDSDDICLQNNPMTSLFS